MAKNGTTSVSDCRAGPSGRSGGPSPGARDRRASERNRLVSRANHQRARPVANAPISPESNYRSFIRRGRLSTSFQKIKEFRRIGENDVDDQSFEMNVHPH